MKLQEFYQPIERELQLVQNTIAEQIQTSDPYLAPVLEELSGKHGKLIRPALLLLCGKLISELNPEHINQAAIIELIHMASLLHDDVIDKARLRRGRLSANALWGNTAAILLGDFLLSKTFTLASRSRLNGTLSLLGRAAQMLCTGEIKQNLLKGRLDLTEQDYFQIIEAKTAALFQCSCHLGACYSNAGREEIDALCEFGFQFGLAFQIADDLRDVLSSEKREGKTLGTDFVQGKLTLPVIHWINQDPDHKQDRINQLSELRDPKHLREQLEMTGSVRYAIDEARQRLERAGESLDRFSTSAAKDALLSLTGLVLQNVLDKNSESSHSA